LYKSQYHCKIGDRFGSKANNFKVFAPLLNISLSTCGYIYHFKVTTCVDGQWFGKLTNPSKRLFLQLDVDSVEDVNRQVDCNNMSNARKAMIHCGMALGVDGSWSLNQLFPHLQ